MQLLSQSGQPGSGLRSASLTLSSVITCQCICPRFQIQQPGLWMCCPFLGQICCPMPPPPPTPSISPVPPSTTTPPSPPSNSTHDSNRGEGSQEGKGQQSLFSFLWPLTGQPWPGFLGFCISGLFHPSSSSWAFSPFCSLGQGLCTETQPCWTFMPGFCARFAVFTRCLVLCALPSRACPPLRHTRGLLHTLRLLGQVVCISFSSSS